MVKNYILTGLRNLMRHKFYSLLNILGLATGIACALLTVLYVDHQYQYDRHHPKIDRIYQVIRKVTDTSGSRYDMRTKAIAPKLKETFPEIEHAVRVFTRAIWVSHQDQGFTVPLAVADKNILDVFNFPLVQGDPKTGLDMPNSVFLSQKLARNLFGETDPIGKTVSVNHKWIRDDYIVTGIFKDHPTTSTYILQFDFLTATFSDKQQWKARRWDGTFANDPVAPLTTYLLLKEGTDPTHLESKLHPFAAQLRSEQDRESVDYYLQPFSRVHLYSTRDYGTAEKDHGDIMRCYTLLGIGLLVLAIACMNYINLVTARSANRTLEVGLRKTVGAARSQLAVQFLSESILVTLFSCTFAILLAQAALPFFNLALESQLALSDLSTSVVVLFPLTIIILVGLLAGSYPAFILSAFEPVRAIKGLSNSGKNKHWLRKGLVVLQFCASVILIVGTLVVYQQTEFMLHKDLGFHKERIILSPFFVQNRALRPKLNTVKQELAKHPNIVSVGAVSGTPGIIGPSEARTLSVGEGKELKFNILFTDDDFFDTLDIPLIEGIPLSEITEPFKQVGEKDGQRLWETSIIMNETAAKLAGWENPVGKVLYSHEGRVTWRIVGLVRDFHNQTLRQEIAPQIYQNTGSVDRVYIRLNTNNIPETLTHIEKVWNQFSPNQSFQYQFLDQHFNNFYQTEMTLRKVYGFFAGLSIFVGCLGMLGLISYTAQQRTKEIGIRKVLGAPSSHMLLLLSRDFLILTAIANIIAWPLAYVLSKAWLENFAYRIDLGPTLFIITGLLTLLIVLLTVGTQAWRAAHANPVESLRYE